MNNELVYSLGDMLDKLSILEIKKEKGLPVENEYNFIMEKAKFYFEKNSVFETLYLSLLTSNKTQYELEDKVRVEKHLKEVGRIALEIRAYNDRRVIFKNEINKLNNSDFLEVKDYKRKEK